MKQGTVKYSEEFVTPSGLKKWYGIELQYNMDTEDPPFDEAKKIVAQAAGVQVLLNESLPPGPPPIISVERTSEDVMIAETIRGIYACTELNGDGGLSSFRNVAFGKIETKLAYEVMEKKLKKQNK